MRRALLRSLLVHSGECRALLTDSVILTCSRLRRSLVSWVIYIVTFLMNCIHPFLLPFCRSRSASHGCTYSLQAGRVYVITMWCREVQRGVYLTAVTQPSVFTPTAAMRARVKPVQWIKTRPKRYARTTGCSFALYPFIPESNQVHALQPRTAWRCPICAPGSASTATPCMRVRTRATEMTCRSHVRARLAHPTRPSPRLRKARPRRKAGDEDRRL
jgi:hypothetical protein